MLLKSSLGIMQKEASVWYSKKIHISSEAI